MKQKLVIWGGWWDKNTPVSLDNINSHASVSAYFLTKYLSEFYDILNIYDFYSAERILDEKEAIAAISTFQHGFTKLVEKGRKEEFERIRRNFKGKLCSLTDCVYPQKYMKYKEDILFTARPPKDDIFRRILDKRTIVERYGWPAEAELCFPEPVPEKEINIFVDHGLYKKGIDSSRVYFNAFKEIAPLYPGLSFNIYRQNNDGIVKWDLNGDFNETRFVRSSKVPYLDILKYYRKCHVFCATHPESAGLAAIEAAMCGARLYVPFSYFRSYISKDLLKGGLAFKSFNCSKRNIVRALQDDVACGFDEREKQRKMQHEVLLKTNTWKNVALKIDKVLKRECH